MKGFYIKLFRVVIVISLFCAFIIFSTLKVDGSIQTSWWIISAIIYVPVMVITFLACLGIYEGYTQRALKTAKGLLRPYDVVVYLGGDRPAESGFLIKHNGIWVIEYLDGSQEYVEYPDTLLKS